MTMSMEMCVYGLVESNPERGVDDLAKEIREKWAYGQQEAEAFLRTNFDVISKQIKRNV